MSEPSKEIGENAIAQIVRLSDWLHDNEPDTFWDDDGDAATVVIGLLEKYRKASPPVIPAGFDTIDAMCGRCGWGSHLHTSIGALDVQVCKQCNIGRVNQ